MRCSLYCIATSSLFGNGPRSVTLPALLRRSDLDGHAWGLCTTQANFFRRKINNYLPKGKSMKLGAKCTTFFGVYCSFSWHLLTQLLTGRKVNTTLMQQLGEWLYKPGGRFKKRGLPFSLTDEVKPIPSEKEDGANEDYFREGSP